MKIKSNPYGIYKDEDIKKYKVDMPVYKLLNPKSIWGLARIFYKNNWNFEQFSKEIERLNNKWKLTYKN